MAMIYNTPVATPKGGAAIQKLSKGDEVLTSDGKGPWQAVTLAGGIPFEGADGTTEIVMVSLGGGAGLTASIDHVFVLQGLQLRIAKDLAVGDLLLRADGQTVAIESVQTGYDQGVKLWNLATSTPWQAGSLAGRLLNTETVMTGDFVLQVEMANGAGS